jgi:peptidylprolyl isomerase
MGIRAFGHTTKAEVSRNETGNITADLRLRTQENAEAPLKIASLTLPLFALCAVTISAQQTTNHTTTTAKHRRAAVPCPTSNPLPALPPGIPPASGKVESAFALRYIDIKTGGGAEAQPGQFYTVHYTGWLASDGTKFDSSLDRNEPFTFQQGVHGVIPGWDNGFGGMHVGGKRRLFIPYQLAYGERGRPPVIPPKSDLIFDLELISASDTPPEPPAPEPPPAQPEAPPTQPEAPPAQPEAPPQTPPPAQTTPPPQPNY